MKTHQTNTTRILFTQSGELLQDHSYYPFGMLMSGLEYSAGTSPENKYLYNGKELQDDFELDWYDYGARMYDAQIGRWHVVDPLAEERSWVSPYHYVQNNPMNRIDPTGALDDWVEKSDMDGNKTIEWDENVTSASDTDLKPGDKYLGEAVVVFNGSEDEKIGKDGTLTGGGAKSAEVTIYGRNGKDDIKTYDGLTMTSNPDEYVPIEDGDYKAFYQDMATSPYGSRGGSLSYRISTTDGKLVLPTKDGAPNKYSGGKPIKTSIFFHRTNNDGDARYSSTGCPIVDGRQWTDVEKQLGKSENIFIRVTR